MLELQNVSKIYAPSKDNPVSAVRDSSLTISPAEFIIITGRSGSGKTTLLNLAAGLTRPTSGTVLHDGQNLWGLSDLQQSRLRNQKIGFIFQFPSLLPALNALDNVALPTIFSKQVNQSKEAVYERAFGLLHTVGLENKLKALPRQLSAGQQQRVVIARALMNNPHYLLADEPTSNLDEKTELEIMDLFQEIFQRTGISVVMVTHTSQLVRFGTRAIEMADGKIISDRLQNTPTHSHPISEK
ncbi:MAG: ABC transporter ATP-binding protein [Holophaga sp.]|nr:ABC transporter ATP-binding protein [Holophaga sp.]